MKLIFFCIFSYFLASLASSNDILFLIDSSSTLNMLTSNTSNNCKHNELIQKFTSDLVYELKECDINYASIQYNIRGYTDYEFSNNNSYFYNKMKHYEFKYGAPTLIYNGLDKIVDLYDLHNYTKQLFIILITDGNNLENNDLHTLLEKYPFNSNDLNNVLIKVGTYHIENAYELDKKYTYNNLSCSQTSLDSILNKYNFCSTISTSTTTLTPNQVYKLDSIYKILVIIIASVIFLFSIIAMIFVFCYKTKNTIRDVPNNQADLNNFYHYRHQSRIIHNSMYRDVETNPDEYIDVQDDNSSLDDDDDIEKSINYLRYNSTQTTDF